MLDAISPVDGRYFDKSSDLREYFSEYAFIKARLLVELCWLQFLSQREEVPEVQLDSDQLGVLDNVYQDFTFEDAERIKAIDDKINHDVKSIEYFLNAKLDNHPTLSRVLNFIHFACTSEDINNVALGIMLKNIREKCMAPAIRSVLMILKTLSSTHGRVPMLSRTHGQSASPTTLGKELSVFGYRVWRQYQQYQNVPILAKFNGAVGNYNAHTFAYPRADWQKISSEFVEQFGLTYNPFTTQIESHDYLDEMFTIIMRVNSILIGFCRDMWGYISLNYFKQVVKFEEIGSSTMPHKVNPINFETAEGNLGIANSLFQHFGEKLLISRWQRDLSDSTVIRNVGVAFAHSIIAYKLIVKGLNRLTLNETALQNDLDNAWEVLAEPIQIIMRKHGITNPYEKIKELTRGKPVDKIAISLIINALELPIEEKERLLALTPSTYIGNAKEQAKVFTKLSLV